MINRATLKQICLFSILTSLFIAPYLLTRGTNIVTHTYAFGSQKFWGGLSPYTDPKGAGDWFKYSPLFAWFYTPFAKLNSSGQAVLWGIFNIVCFWTGTIVWFPWKQLESRWLWLGYLFCSMEADGSFRYQQMNAALVGLTLLGLFFFKQKVFRKSGMLLTLVSNVKILPGLFLIGLCVPKRKQYLQGILLGSAICLIVPLAYWGFSKTLVYHLDWYHLLTRDTNTDGLLDVATVLNRLGLPNAKMLVLYPLSIFSLILFFAQRILEKEFEWDLWIPLGLFTLLLVNPRTESPTFVMGAPGYLFLLRHNLKLKGPTKTLAMVLWSSGIFFITLCMNDIWPRILWNPGPWLHFNKTLGAFLLWLSCVILICRKLKPKQDY